MASCIIVDDSLIVRKATKSILEKAGHAVTALGKNGNEAVELYKEHKPDFITLDITMPQLNGLEALKKIIEFDASAIVIMISSHQQRQILSEALEAGAKSYIIKPFKEAHVIKTVDQVLSKG